MWKIPKIQSRGKALYRVMMIACGGSFMMHGYDAGVLGGVLTHKPFLDAISNPTNDTMIPMIVASYDLAALVTAVAIAPFTFKLGRRGTIIMGNIAAVLGSILQASSYSVAQLIIGRLVTGFAIGCISSAVPAYLSECGMEVKDRGPAGALNGILLISGVPLAYWVDLAFVKGSIGNTQASWRIPIAFECIFAGLSGIVILFLPDTPRWYYAMNREEEGDITLAQLSDADVHAEKVQHTKQEILITIEQQLEASASLKWTQFLTMGIVDKTKMKIIRRLCICFWLPMLLEWQGVSLIAYYSSIVLAQVASPSIVPYLAGAMNTFMALGCVPLYFLIERTGRRSTLLYGAMALTVLMTIFTALTAINNSDAIRWAAVAVIFVFLFIFSWTWQGNLWLYGPEIAPLEYRHIGGAATALGEWTMCFITIFAGPIGFDRVGWKFWLFILSGNVTAVTFVFLLCPETGGKTLEEVDALFQGKAFAGLQRTPGFDFNDEEASSSDGDEKSSEIAEHQEVIRKE